MAWRATGIGWLAIGWLAACGGKQGPGQAGTPVTGNDDSPASFRNLDPDDRWVGQYFGGSARSRQRAYFAGV